MRLVVVGGEKNLPERFATWQRLVDGRVSLIHVFGLTTETTITSTTYKRAANAAGDVKIACRSGARFRTRKYVFSMHRCGWCR